MSDGYLSVVDCSVLEFNIAPPVVGRVLNLTQLKPLTSEKLLKTYFKRGNNYGSL